MRCPGLSPVWKGALLLALVSVLVPDLAQACADTNAKNYNATVTSVCNYESILADNGQWFTVREFCGMHGFNPTSEGDTKCYEMYLKHIPPQNPGLYGLPLDVSKCPPPYGFKCLDYTVVYINSIAINFLNWDSPGNKFKVGVSACVKYHDKRLLNVGLADMVPWTPLFISPAVDILNMGRGSVITEPPLQQAGCGLSTNAQAQFSDELGDQWIEYTTPEGLNQAFQIKKRSSFKCPRLTDGSIDTDHCLSSPCLEGINTYEISCAEDCMRPDLFPFDRNSMCIVMGFGVPESALYNRLRYETAGPIHEFRNHDGSVITLPQSLYHSINAVKLGGGWDPDMMQWHVSTQAAFNSFQYVICFNAFRPYNFFISRFFTPVIILTVLAVSTMNVGPDMIVPRLATATVAVLTVLNSRKDILTFAPIYAGNTIFDTFLLASIWEVSAAAILSIAVFTYRADKGKLGRLIRLLDKWCARALLPIYTVVVWVIVGIPYVDQEWFTIFTKTMAPATLLLSVTISTVDTLGGWRACKTLCCILGHKGRCGDAKLAEADAGARPEPAQDDQDPFVKMIDDMAVRAEIMTNIATNMGDPDSIAQAAHATDQLYSVIMERRAEDAGRLPAANGAPGPVIMTNGVHHRTQHGDHHDKTGGRGRVAEGPGGDRSNDDLMMSTMDDGV